MVTIDQLAVGQWLTFTYNGKLRMVQITEIGPTWFKGETFHTNDFAIHPKGWRSNQFRTFTLAKCEFHEYSNT